MKKYDAIVIGSGAGGSAAAWRLSASGLSVAIIEQGTWFEAAGIDSSEGWELAGHSRLSPVPSVRASKFDIQVDSAESDVEVSFYQALGGSTNIYSGHFPRFRKNDFKRQSDLGLGVDWPMGYGDLEPYYRINEKRMKVSGRVGDPHFPDIDTLGPEVPVGQTGNLVSTALKDLGWHCWVSYGAFDTQQNSRSRCQNYGPCGLGCPANAKMTAVNGYLEEAISKGVDIYDKTSASHLVLRNGIVSEIALKRLDGKDFSLHADLFFLSAGALGTPRILLNSGTRSSSGLANSSGQVGRNLMTHPLGLAEGDFSSDLDTNSGPKGSWMYSLEFGEGGPFGTPGYMLQFLRGSDLIGAGKRQYRTGNLQFGSGLMTSLQRNHSQSIGVAVVVEDLPNPMNRVSLNSEVRDAFGLSGLKVQYRVDTHSLSAMSHGLNSSRKVLSKMGAYSTRGIGPVRAAGWHPSGTARMGSDPSTSVADSKGRSHDIANLFIADASLFPTSSCLNPTNTIQSLAMLVADGAMKDG